MQDRRKAQAFQQRLLDVMNGGALALMTSIGHRTGLFDAMAEMEPSTTAEIARKAALDERYVREWLGAMLTGGIVTYDPFTERFALPTEHALSLTRAASPNNLAAITQYIGLLGAVEDKIVDRFRHGGGVSYDEFPRFHDVMAEDSGQTVLPVLVSHILPLAPGLITKLVKGAEVLDVGCGRGCALNVMGRLFRKSRFRGYDLSGGAVAAGTAEAREHGCTNIHFEVRDVAAMRESERYDLITAFDAIHDQANPAGVLREIHRALKPDGVFLMQDISGSAHVHKNVDHPIGPLLYTISCMHCMTVSLAQNGAGLGAMWGKEKARTMLAAAGFRKVEIHDLPHDVQNCYYVARKR